MLSLVTGTAEALSILRITIPDMNKEAINAIEGTKSQDFPMSKNKIPFPKIKGIVIHLSIKPNIVPVQLSLRRTPVALTEMVKAKLMELEQLDIIERVTEPSQWVSALVAVLKNNGEVRLCVDLRRLNEAIERERHPLPTFQDIMPNLKNAKIFSLLDIKAAYHQCELDKESRHLTTFLTQWGLFRYKRLVFGVSCAPEKFQKAMELILCECKNVFIYIDDILVYGETKKEHDECLAKVLSVLERRNVMLNIDKCKIEKQEVLFLGHKLTSEGIYPAEEKTLAIQQFRPPKDKEELRSFLGMVCFVAKFIPNLATVSFPLRELLKKNVRYIWQSEHQEAFDKIKSHMVEPEKLGYFDPNKKSRLVADASPVGLGAVLMQFDVNNEPVVIDYGAKSLTEAERRYCQPEREALALVWAVEKFKQYLIGVEFELVTDHKALETIFSPRSRPCARIERWVLRLQSFRYKVVYKAGKTNVADPLSRLPQREDEPFDEECDTYINAVILSAAVDIAEVEKVSREDVILQAVKEAIDDRNFDRDEVKDYKFCQNELAYVGDVILRGKNFFIVFSLSLC